MNKLTLAELLAEGAKPSRSEPNSLVFKVTPSTQVKC